MPVYLKSFFVTLSFHKNVLCHTKFQNKRPLPLKGSKKNVPKTVTNPSLCKFFCHFKFLNKSSIPQKVKKKLSLKRRVVLIVLIVLISTFPNKRSLPLKV